MDAIRCLDCGDVRWSLLGIRGEPGTCELCGGEMAPERRRPTGGRPEPRERRELSEHGLVSTPAHLSA